MLVRLMGQAPRQKIGSWELCRGSEREREEILADMGASSSAKKEIPGSVLGTVPGTVSKLLGNLRSLPPFSAARETGAFVYPGCLFLVALMTLNRTFIFQVMAWDAGLVGDILAPSVNYTNLASMAIKAIIM